MSDTNVIEVKDGDLCWPFNENVPAFSTVDGNYTRGEKVDPFPAYAHNVELVRGELTRTAGRDFAEVLAGKG